MLLVSGFRPVPRISDNRSSRVSNLKPINFTSTISDFTRKSNAEMSKAVHMISKKYGDVLCVNYNRKFGKPFENFLKKNGISIKCENIGTKKIYLNHGCFSDVLSFDNTVAVTLVDKNNDPVHSVTNWYVSEIDSDKRPWHFTEGPAKLVLFNELVSGKLEMYEPFKNLRVPDTLKDTATRITKDLNEFGDYWIDVNNSDGLKAQRIQKALEKLFPSKSNFWSNIFCFI